MAAQQPLPFAIAQAESDERKNNLGLFILRVGGDLLMRELLLKVFYHQEKNGQPLVKTYDELAARPWGLCCHPDTVKRLVRTLERMGVLLREEQRYVHEGQKPNAYQISHEGVKAALDLSRRPGVQFAAPSLRSAPTPLQSALPYKEHFLLDSSLDLTSSPKPLIAAPARPAPVPAVPDGFEEAAEALKRLEIGTWPTLLRQAIAAGETPHAFLARIRQGERTIALPANRQKLSSPGGALAKWLREGVWPVSGLLDPDIPSATSAEGPKRTAEQLETEALILAGRLRKQGFSPGKIYAEQRARGLPEVLPMSKAP